MNKQVLVVKYGSAVLTNTKGNIDTNAIKKIAEELSALSVKYNLVIVSSGAVSSGKKYLKNYKGHILERKAAAAVGNPMLLQLYAQQFSKYGKMVAQVLCERHHFSERNIFLQLKETFHEFWNNDIIPIVNENDIVSNFDLRFSDNDELATLIAVGFDAEKMVLCTSAGGFRNLENDIIPKVDKIDEKILGLIRVEKTNVGLGGMLSKLTYTKLATSLGIEVFMCGLEGINPIEMTLNGKYGTQFVPKKVNIKSRNKWLASSTVTIGELIIDKGASKAILERHSLLSIGVKKVQGDFLANEFVKILDESFNLIGVAKVKLAAKVIMESTGIRNVIAAHADDIVLL